MQNMSQNNFIDDFERTEDLDELHSILGRALILATRFDSSCKAAAIHLNLKKTFVSSLDGQEGDVDSYMSEIYRKCKNLHRNIDSLALPGEFTVVLNDAKNARNIIAHDIAVALEGSTLSKEREDALMEKLTECVIDLAYGDIAISSCLAVLNNDPLPNSDYLSEYKDNLVQWVIKRYD